MTISLSPTRAGASIWALLFFLASAIPNAFAGVADVSTDFANVRLLGDDFVVTSLKDSGPGTLRQAIWDARNASTEGSVITFSPKLNGKTIVLTSGQLEVLEDAPPLEISACDLSKGITIDAQQSSRVFHLQSDTMVRMEMLTITGGKAADATPATVIAENGGGIYCQGALEMEQCVVTGNTAGNSDSTGGGIGGGIHKSEDGDLTLIGCVISDNTSGSASGAPSGGIAGGVFMHGAGTATLNCINTTFSGNKTGTGGGSAANGGGIWFNNGFLEVENCTFSQNDCGSSRGGAVFVLILADKSATFLNSTFDNNTAGHSGGGLYFQSISPSSQATLTHCTVTANSAGTGGGLFFTGGGTHTLKNCVVGNNTAPTDPEISGTFTNEGGNIINAMPGLAPLGDYGGPTRTRPPLPGSPALDVADLEDVTTDQRGAERLPLLKVDAGAVEVDCQLEPRMMIEAGANVFTVTSPKDSGKGTLRQAIADANADTLNDSVIVFSTKLRGKTIKLTSGQLEVTNDLAKIAIIGGSVAKGSTEPVDLVGGVTISGNGMSRVFQFGRLYQSPNIVLRNLTITGGKTPDVENEESEDGAGISHYGVLKLQNCTVANNTCGNSFRLRGGNGGGIFSSEGELTLIQCRILNNAAGNSVGTFWHEGRGGGLFTEYSSFVCINSTISRNKSGSYGGGFYVSRTQSKFVNSTISNNEAWVGGGGHFFGSDLVDASGEMTNCTVTGNSVKEFDGGGFSLSGVDINVVLTHCTIAKNTAVRQGGGVLVIDHTSTLTVENTIVTANTAPMDPNIATILGAFTETGTNFIGTMANLAPLGDYGGPTKTMPPLPGSPVINNATSGVVETDQRGALRDDLDGDDIGAVEVDADILRYLTRITEAGATSAPASGAVGFIEENAAGNFSGSVLDGGNSAEGIATAKMTSTGAISVNLTVGPLGLKRAGFKIQLDGSGDFPEATVTIKGVDYQIAMTLNETTSGNQHYSLFGYIYPADDPGKFFQFNLDQPDFHKKLNPAPFAGKYTALLPATTDQQAPQGDGYGLASVGTDGKIKFSGALGDGSKFTVGGFVSANTQWQLFKELYRTKPKGRISGTVTFQEDLDGASDFSGSLVWIKEEDSREKYYPDGFEIPDQKIIGSKYVAPFPNEAILSAINPGEPDNATWEIGKGNVPTPAMQYVTWNGKNRVSAAHLAAGESLKIRPSTKSGLVKGSYQNKFTRQKVAFAGVAFQKQNVVAGLFPGKDGETGFFAMKPAGKGELRLQWDETNLTDRSGAIEGLGDIGIDGGRGRSQLYLANIGTGILHITGISLTNDMDFSVINGGPKFLKPGEGAYFGVLATPQYTGSTSTDLRIDSNGGQAVYTFDATGVGGSMDWLLNGIFNDWSGFHFGDTPPPFMTDNIPAGTFDPATHGGTYQGFIHQGDRVTGFASVKISTKSGGVSGSVFVHQSEDPLAGKTDPFKGVVDSDGHFAGDTLRVHNYVEFNVAQVTDGSGGFKLIGNTSPGGDFELVRNPFHKTTNPATAFAKSYTLLLPSNDARGADAPKGNGYGSANVELNGKLKSAIVLGDGTKVSYSGFVSADGEWLLYKALYRSKPKGHLAGRLQFRDVATISDFDGELNWVKHADKREKRFNRGFEIRQLTLGSVYTVPAAGERAFDTDGFAELKFTEGDVLNLPGAFFTNWDTNNRVTQLMPLFGEKLSVKVNSKTGIVTGSYSDKGRKIKVPFGGAIFEKQDILTGLFIGNKNTGVMEIVPSD